MNKKTVAIFAICMLLVSALSVFATLALLTDTSDTVTNTFTSGNVQITLWETVNGVKNYEGNSYSISPATEYDKDPTITLAEGSESSYLGAELVLVRGDEIKTAYGLTTNNDVLTHATKGFNITLNSDWSIVDSVKDGNNIKYYLVYANTATAADYQIFNKITAPDTTDIATTGTQTETDAYVELFKNVEMQITGYAVQSANSDSDPATALKTAFTGFAPNYTKAAS